MNDLRSAGRMLAKSPGFTAAAVVTLALGIGLNTAVFSLVNAVLLKPLPVRDPARLVYLNAMNPSRGFGEHSRYMIAYPDYLDWRAQNRFFEDVGVYQGTSWTVTGRGDPERVHGATISATLFSVLGVTPVLGRNFQDREDQPGSEPVVLLGYQYWQRRFGADTTILTQSLNLNGKSHAVVGVMRPGFRFPYEADLWVPLVVQAPERLRGAHSLEGIARLKPGASLEQAIRDLKRISRILEAEHPETNAGVLPVIRPWREELVKGIDVMSWLLLGAVGFVLAVACANVANLTLSRALGRQREWAIRLALGSSRWRLTRLVLAESLLLATAGGVAGLIFSKWGVALALALVPEEVPFWLDFSPDHRVLLFTLAAVVVSCLFSGLAPAWHASRADPMKHLRSGSPGGGDKPRGQRLRGTLVAVEVAVALLLLAGTSLMARTTWNLQQADPGFNPQNVLTFSVTLWQETFSDSARRIVFFRELRERLAALPGVKSAAAVVNLPLAGENWSQAFYLEARPKPSPGQMPSVNMRIITPGYFRTMEIPLVRGRDFNDLDEPAGRPVVIIDETFARVHFPNEDPVGQRLKLTFRENISWEIIGVSGEIEHYGIGRPSQPGVYLPFTQFPAGSMILVLKTEPSAVPGLLHAARSEVHRLDRDVVVAWPRLMGDLIARSFWEKRFIGQLFASFALLALVLACVGIAAVVSYAVSQRTHEIGVRRALGATESEIIRLVVRQGMRKVLAGVGLGLVASWGLLRLLQSELYGVSATNPRQYLLLALPLAFVALLACYVPARRAAKVDPNEALRYE